MTIDIAEDRRIIDQATPGPWEIRSFFDGANYISALVEDGGTHQVADCFDNRTANDQQCSSDAAFIATARTRWPAALDEIERLHGRLLRCTTDDPCPTCARGDGTLCMMSTERGRLAQIDELRAALAAMTTARDELGDWAESKCPDDGQLPPRSISELRPTIMRLRGVDRSTRIAELRAVGSEVPK